MDRLVLTNENIIIAMWSHVLSLGSCVLLFHILAIYVCQQITLLITKYCSLFPNPSLCSSDQSL